MFTAAYVRVSTEGQTTENQVLEITGAGFVPTMTVREEAVSGKMPAAQRPEFAGLLATFERVTGPKTLVCTKIDRLGRNAADVLQTVSTLQGLGVEVVVLQLGKIDLTSAAGKLILTVMSAVAEMERDLIVERTHAGLARARKAGKALGRPQALTPTQRREAAKALAEGASVNSLARRYDCARGTIRRLRAA